MICMENKKGKEVVELMRIDLRWNRVNIKTRGRQLWRN